MKRVILIEPVLNDNLIESLFNKYNPDSSFANPHICLVFPFESSLTKEDINNILERVLNDINSFSIELKGIEASYEDTNNYLFLKVQDKDNILHDISNNLYKELGNNAKLKGIYNPHITIAKDKDKNKINIIKEKLEKSLNNTYNAYINKISSKIISKDINNKIILIDEVDYYLENKKFNIKK